MENNFLMEKPNNERLKHCMVKIFKGVSMHDYITDSTYNDWCSFYFPEGIKEKLVDDEYYKVWFQYHEASDPMDSSCQYTINYIEVCREDIKQYLMEKEKFEPLIIDYLKK